MNTEDFVTYEQALALKKLGFKEECLYYYNQYHILSPEFRFLEKVIDKVTTSDLYFSTNVNTKVDGIYDAPTLAQAQKWLRKEKGIYIDIISLYEPVFEAFIKAEYYPLYKIMEERFNSYEEALSAGITECLKLLNKRV